MLQRAFIGSLRYIASRRRIEVLDPLSIGAILVVELTRLGDVLAMMPSLARLQSFFPHAGVRVMTDRRYVSLLDSITQGFSFIGVNVPGSPMGAVEIAGHIRKVSVDLAISMSPPRRNVAAVLSSNARFTMGYLTYVDSLTPFLLVTPVEAFGFKLPVQVSYTHENIYARSARLCEALGIDALSSPYRAEIKPGIVDAVRGRLTMQGIIPRNRYVMLHPFSGWEYRDWGLAEYIALGNRIVDEAGFDVVICCETKDAGRVHRALTPASSLRVAAPSDLLEAAVLMTGAALVVCNDSGPLHLAALLHVQSVGLFGPASPGLTAPPSGRGTSLYKKVECSPCDQRVCVRPDRPCMGLHTVSEVFAAVARALGLQVVR